MIPRLKGLQAERAKRNRAVFMLMTTPDGEGFMEWLSKQDRKILRKTNDGAVDPYAMAYVAGQHDLIQTVKDMIEDGKLAR